jgi:enoyl-CoA hydratase/carnithine racemase
MDGILTIQWSDLSGLDGVSGLEKLKSLLKLVHTDEDVRVLVLREDGGGMGSDLTAVAHELCQMPQPIIAFVYEQPQAQALVVLQACDIVFATQAHGAWVTLCVPASDLESQTYQLARDLAAKDALALRYTKKTLHEAAAVSWDEILNFTTVQQAEIKALQSGRPTARAMAIESFLSGQFKPGAGA